MCSAVVFVLGLVVLFRGPFRFGSRFIDQQRARLIAGVLISPILISFCVSFALGVFNAGTLFSADGEINIEAFTALVNNAAVFELLLLAVALVAAGYVVYNAPTTPPQNAPMPGSTSGARGYGYDFPASDAPQPRRGPDILTVPEVAQILRVSEAEVMQLIDEGRLPAARIGDSFRIARSALDDFTRGGA